MRPLSERHSTRTSGGTFVEVEDIKPEWVMFKASIDLELWSQGHRYLKGQQPSNTLDTGGQGSRPTEEGDLPGCVIPGHSGGSCKVPTGRKDSSISNDRGKTAGVGGVWRGHEEGLSVGTKVSGKPFDTSGGENGEPSKLYIVRMGHCLPQLRK